MIRKKIVFVVNKVVPKSSRLHGLLREAAINLRLIKRIPPFTPEYLEWQNFEEKKLFQSKPRLDKDSPLVSVVVPCFNTPDKYLLPMVYSIVGQSYEGWELVIANASTNQERKKAINHLSEIDSRIKIYETANKGISHNTNIAIKNAKGAYVAFIDHDDLLHRNALEEVIKTLKEADYAIIYTDEDKITEDGNTRHSPFIKPDWSPHLFLQLNYLNHLTVIKRSEIEKAGGLRRECDGAQDYDLILRIIKRSKKIKIRHINRILYHWRVADNSTAQDISNKSYIFASGEKALADFLNADKRTPDIDVRAIPGKPGFYQSKVTKEHLEPVAAALWNVKSEKIEQNLKENLDVHTIFSNKKNTKGFKQIKSENVQDFIIDCFKNSKEKRLLLVQGNVNPVTSDWIDQMLRFPETYNVRTVIGSLFDSDKRITSWPKSKINNNTIKLFEGVPFGVNTFHGDTDWVRDVEGRGYVSLINSRNKDGYDVVIPYAQFVTTRNADKKQERNYYDVNYFYGENS